MPSANVLITQAFRLLNVLGTGETPSDAEAEDARVTLNQMVDAWGAERLTMHEEVRTAFTLTSGTGTYTIGTGGNFNIVRPVWIDRGSVILDSAATDPLELPISGPLTVEQFQRIAQKSTDSSYPTYFYYDWGFDASERGNITVYPIQNRANVQLVLYTPGLAVSQFTNLTTVFVWPPGYQRAIKYNLAMELAPEYGVKQIHPIVERTARRSFAVIQAANAKPPIMRMDNALVGRKRWDFRTGNP